MDIQEHYTLLTPESVELRYEVAGIGSRLAAAMVDYTLVFLGYVVLIFAGALGASLIERLIESELAKRVIDSGLGVVIAYALLAIVVLLVFLGWWGYFVLFELLWNGQTPGKRMLGLRVVGLRGQPISAMASLTRNALRIVDLALFLGVVVMFIDRSSRRLGDFAAGSMVIREPRIVRDRVLASVEIPVLSEIAVRALPNAGRITAAHYALIRDYFARRQRLRPLEADALALQLAGAMGRLLEVEPASVADATTFLATVARAFEAQHQYREA